MMFLKELIHKAQRFQDNAFLSLGCVGDIDVVIYQSNAFESIIALQGAQLLHWQPTGHAPMIFTSPESTFTKGTPIRGGVPVCWPWFGRRHTPMHGFARLLPWRVKDFEATESGLVIAFNLSHSVASQCYTKSTFSLDLTLSLSATTCELALGYDSEDLRDVTAALHSYFMVGDIGASYVANMGNRFFNALTQMYEEVPDPRFCSQALDGYYAIPQGPSVLVDTLYRRRLHIEHQASNVVLWNPWDALSDLSTESSRHMLCVESAYIDQVMVKGTKLRQKITYQSGEACDEIA